MEKYKARSIKAEGTGLNVCEGAIKSERTLYVGWQGACVGCQGAVLEIYFSSGFQSYKLTGRLKMGYLMLNTMHIHSIAVTSLYFTLNFLHENVLI